MILVDSSPEFFGAWLRETVSRVKAVPEQERVVFINAWNERAEGNHLEPCERWGRPFLEATREVLKAGS